ncbi:MAG: hypothetical protein WBV85_08095 [Solirubrobacteraceae bacterium]
MRGYGLWLCALVACVCGLFCAGPALAKEVHLFRSSFGASGSGSGQFDRPLGVAVNEATHDMYVVDSGNNRVEWFNSDGSAFLGEFNGSASPTGDLSEPTEITIDNSSSGLDPSKEDVYVVDRGHGVIDKFDSTGTYLGQITGVETPGGVFDAGAADARSIEGVAVDQDGTLWVTIKKGGIFSFSDTLESKYLSELQTSFGFADGLGVDGEDNFFIKKTPGISNTFLKLSPLGEVLANPFSQDGEAQRVAVDPVGREVYLDNLSSIEAFSLSGEPIESCIPPEDNCFGLGHLGFSKGVAVDAGSGTVYAADETADNVSVFEGIILPDVSITAVSEQHTHSATLNGTINPRGKPVVSCVFEYGVTVAYGSSVPCSPAGLGSGVSPVAVDAHISGLVPGTEYHYRLVAQNSAPTSSNTPDSNLFAGPLLDGESVGDVASSSATLLDMIDPNGADTHYYIEYGQTGLYGSVAPVAVPGVDLGGLVGSQSLAVHLQGLEASSVYHYRFVAVQDGEVFAEPDQSFTTQSGSLSASLPDGRSWELVSPANKRGAVLETTEGGGQVQAASDGGGITYVGEGPSVDPNADGKMTYSQILSTRGAGGWSSQDVTLPGRSPEDNEPAESLYKVDFNYHLFSLDLSSAAVEPQPAGTPLLSPEASSRTLYLRNNLDGVFTPLVSSADVPENTVIEEEQFLGANPGEWEMHFLAGTPDLSHVVFESVKALTSNAIDGDTIKNRIERHESLEDFEWNLYEWDSEGLKLVNILPPPGEEVAHGSKTPIVALAGVNAEGLPRGSTQRSVSADGRRIAWTLGEPFSTSKLEKYKGLYVRDMVEERTVRIGGATALYQTMNSTGSKIFYLENGDLYVYDWDSGTPTDLTANHGAGESSAGVQESVSDVSKDGSYVYFVAKGDLAEGGVGGEYNLYVLHDTGNGWVTKHVATLAPQDKPTWYAAIFAAPYLAGVSSRVSPDGRYFVFMSQRSLTGYDNVDAASNMPDEEVYLYDAQGAGKLVCASCDPSGARPRGVFDGQGSRLLVDREQFWAGGTSTPTNPEFDHWLAGSVPGWDNLENDPATYQPRYLSDSGRVFFDSPVGLVAGDTNGLEDVYEYEPVSISDCVTGSTTFSERSDGCVALISSGTSSEESAFYDASENGDDVFFTTTGKLVSTDFDKGYDVYDAHVCTSGTPCVATPVLSPPCSSGDSCKAAPSPQPEIFGPAPSATFNGTGNVVAPPTTIKARSLTNAQKLTRALKACHRDKGKRRRVCERQAHKRYPSKPVRKKAPSGNGRKRS